MQEVTRYPNNTFSWIDLSTTDTEGAKRFYTELFGWTAEDTPIPQGGTYTMLRQDGKDVAALSRLQEEQIEQGHPPFWNSYISVKDVDAATEKAEAAGATVMMPPMDVLDAGRMSMIQDPTEAFVCLWQPVNHIGAQLVNIPNTLVWNELFARDSDRAAAFYSEVFGWESQAQDQTASSIEYTTFVNNGRYACGLKGINEELEGVPPHWAVYFAVEDVEATTAKAQELGGQVIRGPFETGGTGTMAVLQDPQGATFNIIEMANADPMP